MLSQPVPESQNAPAHRFCVAPMMDRTDRHCRYLLRLMSRHARLYTEMITAAALTHVVDPRRFLDFDPSEHPLALQLGGSDPGRMAKAASLGQTWGYDEINLNIGCPSPRVTVGRFGACLMTEPALVADCVRAIGAAVTIPVTVKTRIGVDMHDSDQFLDDFVGTVSAAGCDVFMIHARKAWLKGLSPKENREIPPLNYDRAVRLKRAFPHLTVILNGGLTRAEEALASIRTTPALDGVMVGRAAYDTPFLMAEIDRLFFDHAPTPPNRAAVAEAYVHYVERSVASGVSQHLALRHISGLFHGLPGARAWRRAVSQVCQATAPLSDLIQLAYILEKGEPLAA